MNYLKKAAAIVIMISLLCGLLPCVQAAEPSSPPLSSALLDAMLTGNRAWVIDTLVEDNLSTNPQAKLDGTDTHSLMSSTLDNYRGAEATGTGKFYKGLIDAVFFIDNADDYVADFFDSATETWSSAVTATNLFASGEDFKQTAQELSASMDELQFESILKAALTKDYVSDSGITLGEADTAYANAQQLKKALDAETKYMSFLKEAINTLNAGEAKTINSYINDYGRPFSEATAEFLRSISADGQTGTRQSDAWATVTADLATAARFMIYEPGTWFGDTFGAAKAELYEETGVKTLLSGAGKVFDYASTTVDTYIYLNMLQAQKDSLTGPLLRTARQVGANSDMGRVLRSTADKCAATADAKTVEHEAMLSYLRSNNTLSKYATKAASAAAKKLLKLGEDHVLTRAFARIASIPEIALWVADQAINIKDTAKKTFELLYLEKLITALKTQYAADLAVYQSSGTEEAASDVLDDLMLLQKLRLYGEDVSYNMAVKQLDGVIGLVFGWASVKDDWQRIYQTHVNALLEASVLPVWNNIFTVEPGDTLMLTYTPQQGWYGVYTKVERVVTTDPVTQETTSTETKTIVSIADILGKLANGLYLNGGTLLVSDAGPGTLSLPAIECSGNASIMVVGDALRTYELFQNNGTLTLYRGSETSFEVTGLLHAGNLCASGTDRQPLYARNVELGGSVTGAELAVRGDCAMTAGSTLDALRLCGEARQNITGQPLRVSNLAFANTSGGVSVSCPITVTGEAGNVCTAVSGGKNVTLASTGTITGNYYHSDLTLNGTTLGKALRFGGSVYTVNSCAFTHALTVDGDLCAGSPVHCAAPSVVEGNLRVNGTVRCDETMTVGDCLYGNAELICGGLLRVNGSLYSKADMTCSAGAAIHGSYIATGTASKTHCYPDGWTLDMDGDVSVELLTLTGVRQITCGGDWQSANLTMPAMVLTLDGAFPQTVYSPLTLSTLHLRNTSKQGVTINGILNVTELLGSNSTRVTGGKNIQLSDSARLSFENNTFPGSLTATSWDVTQTSTIRGDLYVTDQLSVQASTLSVAGSLYVTDQLSVQAGTLNVTGSLYVTDQLSVQAGTLNVTGSLYVTDQLSVQAGTLNVTGGLYHRAQSGGSALIATDSSLRVAGACQMSNLALTADGTLYIGGDAVFETVNVSGGGRLTLGSDLTTSGTFQVHTLAFTGKLPQTVTGSPLSVTDLLLDNPSAVGVTLDCPIIFSGQLITGGTRVTQRQSAKLSFSNATIAQDMVYKSSLQISDGLTLSHCHVTVMGDLQLDSGALVLDHAVLEITGRVLGGKSVSLSVDENSSLTAPGMALLTNAALSVDGAFRAGSDTVLTNASLTGGGTVYLGGDVYATGLTCDFGGTLCLDGKLLQVVDAANLRCGTLHIRNTCRDGIRLNTDVYYTDSFIDDNARVQNTGRVIEK